ncbi:hypothetical protein CHU98_g9006 [Xylaria longipes]|nr:hypothetical protein CHU98_g9006 [Xylaria longipes]
MGSTGFSGHPSSPPSSPWAKRFPLSETNFKVENTYHSLLAPQFPRINDPKYYDQEPDPNIDHIPKTYADIDRLLWSEKIQRKSLWGLQTWQVAALTRRLYFQEDPGMIYGGHREPFRLPRGILERFMDVIPSFRVPRYASPTRRREEAEAMSWSNKRDMIIYTRQRIKVDETKWFPFLRKDRWFDWVQFSPDNTRSPRRTWSVDDPKLWADLSVCIELANRILRSLIEDRHHGDYWSKFEDIFGKPPYENASVLLSHSMEKTICKERGIDVCQWDRIITRTVKQSNDRLVELLSTLIWGFQEHYSGSQAVTFGQPPVSRKDKPYSSIITLDVHKLETMRNWDNLVLAEVCALHVDIAITTVKVLLKPDITWNNFFFGGIQKLEPELDQRPNPPPLVQIFKKWPWASHAFESQPADRDSDFLKDGAAATIYHVPSTYPSKLLAESFWQNLAYSRKSDNFFHKTHLFRVRAPILNRRATEFKEPAVVKVVSRPYTYPEDDFVLDAWKFQLDHWDSIRTPWYKQYNDVWESSPWSNLEERYTFYLFEDAFVKKDHIKCANIASSLIHRVDWTRSLSTYKKYMPSKDKASSSWIWHAIGLLMMASIPLRRRALLYQEREGAYWYIELAPSREAAAAGHDMMVYTSPDRDDPQKRTADTSEFYNPTKPRGGKIDNFTQLDYLDLIDDMIRLIIQLDGVIHIKFLSAISDAKNALRRDRQNLAVNYPGVSHTTRWASDWVFKFPKYNPTICSFYRGQWVERVMDFD